MARQGARSKPVDIEAYADDALLDFKDVRDEYKNGSMDDHTARTNTGLFNATEKLIRTRLNIMKWMGST